MSDEANTAAAEQETTNALSSDEQGVGKFQGFATKDGERVEPAAAAADKPAKQGGEAKAKGKDDAEEAGEPEDDAGKRHKSAQDRINKAVGRQRAAERHAADLERRLAALEARAQGGSGTGEPPKEKNTSPTPADYEFGELDAKYIRDLARYEARQEYESQRTQSKKQEDNASQTKAQQAMQARLDTFYSRGVDIAEDFDEVVSDQGLNISPVLGELVLESDFGPQIAYAMASDPKEAKRVSAMSPARQAAWFGQKEAELSSESSDAEEATGQERPHSYTSLKTTKAPPPPKGKARGSGTAQQVSPATSDFSQFERLAMKKQE